MLGGIQIVARKLELKNRSLLVENNFAEQVAGNVTIILESDLHLSGDSSIQTGTGGPANAADLIIQAHDILISENSSLFAGTVSSGNGGTVMVTAANQVSMSNGAKITSSTRAIVVINPNNPTGALYPDDLLKEIVEIARTHNLIIYADEVYDRVLYDGATHTSIASLAEDVLTITFNSLSKNYRACGYRAGWMIVSGDKKAAQDYIVGLDILSSMRLCANAPGQWGIQTALGGYQSIDDLVAPGGRMRRQRDIAYELITAIPGVTCVKPLASLYMFPRLDPKIYPISDDQEFISELLVAEKVLLVQGSGFNWPHPDHFRLVFLPHEDDLREAIGRIARFLDSYRTRHGK